MAGLCFGPLEGTLEEGEMSSESEWKSGGYYRGVYVSDSGEPVELRDFYRPHDPVYVPGFEPGAQPKGGARQEFKDECDVNVIMAKYEGAWPPPPLPGEEPPYMDLSYVPGTLLEAHEFIAAAEHAFIERVPAKQRLEMFGNSPFNFVEYASNPDNLPKLREWGLAPAGPAEPAGAVSPPPATPPAESVK